MFIRRCRRPKRARAGEPAIGPVAFPHRISARANPLAPITHHWFDSTHITFRVVTGGISGRRWKAEASAFNGREPDEDRIGLDLAPLDSFSGRLWFLPAPRWALQVSAANLNGVEPGEDGGPRVYGRLELAQKSAYDLVVPEPPDSFTVAKLQGGYTRYLAARNGFQPGLGAGASVGLASATLRNAYGSRANAGVAVDLTLRPAAVVAAPPAAPPPDHSQHVNAGP